MLFFRFKIYFNQLEDGSNELHNRYQNRPEANRAQVIADEMSEADQDGEAQLALVAREEPFGDCAGNYEVLTAEQKLREPEESEEVDPSSGRHCSVLYVTDLNK